MVAKILTYELESPSYGDSKLEKWKNFTKKIVYPSSNLVYGEQVFTDAVKNGSKN